MRLSIVIPAYNEEQRIGRTLAQYSDFLNEFQQNNKISSYELLVVLNGCKDGTCDVVRAAQKENSSIRFIDLAAAGKGLAVAAGFRDALLRPNDLIGFVDADGATAPQHFCELVARCADAHGAIASRYMKGAQIYPPRPFVKKWGNKIFYHGLIKALYNMPYKDFQCGAKLFTRAAMEKIAPQLTVRQWAFDVELLYRCKQQGLTVCEVPTVWRDQTGSKLKLRSGLRMLGALVTTRFKKVKQSQDV